MARISLRRSKFLSLVMTEPPKKKRKHQITEASQPKPKRKKNAPEDENDFVVRWQNPALQADLILEKLRTLNPKMTSIELGELSIPGTAFWEKAFVDTATWGVTDRKAADIPAFLQNVIPEFEFSTSTNAEGSPHTLVISPAALRVADLTRALKSFRSHGKAEVAKLFARHFKLSEHIAYVKKTLINIAVGTPGRIRAIVEAEDGVLKLDKLRYLVIDANYTDGKRRTIFDIPETLKDLFGILAQEGIRKRVADTKLKVVFY